MDLNDALQWIALGVTILLGGLGLYFQRAALRVAQEDVSIARAALDLERERHRIALTAQASPHHEKPSGSAEPSGNAAPARRRKVASEERQREASALAQKRLALEEAKLAERRAAREQKAVGAAVRWFLDRR